MAPVVVLIGAPGAGKSTVGRLVADKLGVEFRDTDADIEATSGKSIPDIFVVDGEPMFRALEHDAVVAALAEHSGVLALGGGAVLDARTQELLRDHHVVWLQVSAHNAAGRVGVSGPRPVVVGNPHSTMVKLLADRTPIYESVATVTIDTDFKQPDAVAAEVLASITDRAAS